MPRGGRQPGAGNPGYGINKQVAELKLTLIKAVLEDCKKNPDRKLYWAKEFSNKLLPTEVAGKDGGAIEHTINIHIDDSKFQSIIEAYGKRTSQ